MGEPLDPRFAAAVRGALLDEVRAAPATTSGAPSRSPRPRRPRWQPVLGLAIAAATVVAIVVGLSVAGRQRSAEPAQQPFGGDCAAVLTADRAESLIGKPLVLRHAASPLTSQEALAVPVVGGLQCSWSGDGDAQDAAGIVLTVLPVALRPRSAVAEDLCFGSNDGADHQFTCTLDAVTGGRWFTGFVTGLTGGAERTTKAALADLEATLDALPAAEDAAPLDTTGWWSATGCARLGREADLASALGRPGLEVQTGNGGMRSAGQGAAVDRAVALNCILAADEDTDAPFGAEVHAVAGAGPVVTPWLTGPDVRRLADVDGARVYRVAGASGQSTLWVVADGGALQLIPPYDTDARTMLPAVAPVLAALDTHLRGSGS